MPAVQLKTELERTARNMRRDQLRVSLDDFVESLGGGELVKNAVTFLVNWNRFRLELDAAMYKHYWNEK